MEGKDCFPVTERFHFLLLVHLVRKLGYSYVVGKGPDAVGFATQEHTFVC